MIFTARSPPSPVSHFTVTLDFSFSLPPSITRFMRDRERAHRGILAQNGSRDRDARLAKSRDDSRKELIRRRYARPAVSWLRIAPEPAKPDTH